MPPRDIKTPSQAFAPTQLWRLEVVERRCFVQNRASNDAPVTLKKSPSFDCLQLVATAKKPFPLRDENDCVNFSKGNW